MKTAKQWCAELATPGSLEFVEDLIGAVQCDAIESAAKVIGDEMAARPTFYGVYGGDRGPLGRLVDEIRALAPVRR